MDITYAVVVGQIAVVGMLFRWLQVQVRDIKLRTQDMYTKDETNDRIDLKLEPIKLGIEHVQKDITELKVMIGRLLDAKNKE